MGRHIGGQFAHRDQAVVVLIRISAKGLDQHFGEGAVFPFRRFDGLLPAGGGGEDHDAVFGAGQLVENPGQIGRVARLGVAEEVARMAGVEEDEHLAGDGGQGTAHLAVG